MKLVLTLASLGCTLLLLAGCADQSLISDEDYARNKGPAPYSPDATQHLPPQQSSRPAGW